MNVTDAIARQFVAEGVETVFDLMSEDVIGLVSELDAHWGEEIRLVDARHEQGAAGMADGFARANVDGSIGVCLVGRGPAIAQTGTSILTARKRGSRVLYVTAEPRQTDPNDLKRFDQEGYLESTVGEVISIRDPSLVRPRLHDAFRRIRAGEGPIAVQIPWDVLESEIDDAGGEGPAEAGADGDNTDASPGDGRIQPDAGRIEAVVEAYLDSDATKAPVVLAGRGAVRAGARDALETLAERMNAFLATTLQAKGFFGDHPFGVGIVGDVGSVIANERITGSDFVLAVGCSLTERTTDSGHLLPDEATLVHVDTDPASFGRNYEPDLPILGDARTTTEAFHDALAEAGIDRAGEFWTDRERRRIAEYSPWDGRPYSDAPDRMDPKDVVDELDDLLPADRLVAQDAGHFNAWLVDGISVQHPDDWLWTLDFIAVGQGLPIGIGAALADRDRTCVTFCGDAGLMMSLQELETAVRHDVPMFVVVMNDATLGAEYHQANDAGYSGDPALVEPPEFAAVAESLGAEGYTATSAADLRELADVLGTEPDGPVLVDCKIDREIRHRFTE